MLLIEPDGPFAKHDRSLRFCLERLRCRLSLPPGSDAVNLERPSTMGGRLGYSFGLDASLAVQCLGFKVPVAVGKPFVLKLQTGSADRAWLLGRRALRQLDQRPLDALGEIGEFRDRVAVRAQADRDPSGERDRADPECVVRGDLRERVDLSDPP